MRRFLHMPPNLVVGAMPLLKAPGRDDSYTDKSSTHRGRYPGPWGTSPCVRSVGSAPPLRRRFFHVEPCRLCLPSPVPGRAAHPTGMKFRCRTKACKARSPQVYATSHQNTDLCLALVQFQAVLGGIDKSPAMTRNRACQVPTFPFWCRSFSEATDGCYIKDIWRML